MKKMYLIALCFLSIFNFANVYAQSDDRVTVLVAPIELNFPQGMNTMVGDGDIGDYVTAVLMEYLLRSNRVRLLDRSVWDAQMRELEIAGEYVDANTAIQRGKIIGARYIVKVTMQKPDVVNVSNNIPVGEMRRIVRTTTNTQNSNWGNNQNNGTQWQRQQSTLENVQTTNVKVSVNIKTTVVDLQTGEVLFMSSATGTASGTPQLAFETSNTNNSTQDYYDPQSGTVRTELNQGAEFSQTVTGKAIEDAFKKKIGRELINYFDKQLKR
jgi:hypothetical protein